MHGYLSLNQRLLTSWGQCHVDDLKVHAVGVQRLQSRVDIHTKLLGVPLTVLPEGSGVEITDDLADAVIDLRNEGLLVVLLVVLIEFANVVFLKQVLHRE